MTIVIEKTGRRYYLVGNTYAVKDRIKAAGCKWDPERRAWWTSKQDVAEEIKAALADVDDGHANGDGGRQGAGDEQVVAGRATYKGKTYYIAGRIERGRTRWDRDRVHPVETRDGAKVLLVFRDGSKTFWAAREAVQVVKSYSTPQTIGGLREFAQRERRHREAGGAVCVECGKSGELVIDLEDGAPKHPWCCDMPPAGY